MRIGSRIAGKVAAGAALLAIGGALSVAMTTAAYADTGDYYQWNSSSNPLTVSGYGSNGQGYGQWRVANTSNGIGSFLDANLWYYNADNHKVYAQLETESNCRNVNNVYMCDNGWYAYRGAETSHYNVPGVWKWNYASTDVDGTSPAARAQIDVCIDVPWRYDPCSGYSYAGPSSY